MKYLIVAILFIISLVYSGYYLYKYDKKLDKREGKVAVETSSSMKTPEYLTKKFWHNVTPEQLKEKLKKIEDVNEVRTDNKRNMLHLLVWHGQHPEMVSFLVSAGVDYTRRDGDMITPIHYIFVNKKNNSFEFLTQFLKFNIDINMIDGKSDASLLMWSVYQRAPIESIRLLLEKGANPNSKNRWGYTSIMLASKPNKRTGNSFIDPDVVQLLLDYKADITIKADNGKTALDYMKENEEFMKTDLFKRLSSQL